MIALGVVINQYTLEYFYQCWGVGVEWVELFFEFNGMWTIAEWYQFVNHGTKSYCGMTKLLSNHMLSYFVGCNGAPELRMKTVVF